MWDSSSSDSNKRGNKESNLRETHRWAQQSRDPRESEGNDPMLSVKKFWGRFYTHLLLIESHVHRTRFVNGTKRSPGCFYPNMKVYSRKRAEQASEPHSA